MTWNKLYKQISSKTYQNRSSLKHQRYALLIVKAARLWKFPNSLSDISVSNFREINSLSKIAIQNDDQNTLRQLLDWAGTMTNQELRIKIHGNNRIEIPVTELNQMFSITVNQQQLDRIQKSTRTTYQYNIL